MSWVASKSEEVKSGDPATHRAENLFPGAPGRPGPRARPKGAEGLFVPPETPPAAGAKAQAKGGATKA